MPVVGRRDAAVIQNDAVAIEMLDLNDLAINQLASRPLARRSNSSPSSEIPRFEYLKPLRMLGRIDDEHRALGAGHRRNITQREEQGCPKTESRVSNTAPFRGAYGAGGNGGVAKW